MMPMDPGDCFDLDELARLACLDLDEHERSIFAPQLRLMVEAFNRISELSTDGIEPFAHSGDSPSAMRADEATRDTRGAGLCSVPRLFVDRRGGGR